MLAQENGQDALLLFRAKYDFSDRQSKHKTSCYVQNSASLLHQPFVCYFPLFQSAVDKDTSTNTSHLADSKEVPKGLSDVPSGVVDDSDDDQPTEAPIVKAQPQVVYAKQGDKTIFGHFG